MGLPGNDLFLGDAGRAKFPLMKLSCNPADRPRHLRSITLCGAMVLASTLSCEEIPTSTEGLGELWVTPTSTLLVGVGATLQFEAEVAGIPSEATEESSPTINWSSDNPAVATVSAGGVATAVDTGTTLVTANATGFGSGTATLEVWVPPEVESYEAGETHFGRASYTEYVVGDLPIIISAPHGGAMVPEEITDRTYGTTGRDTNTQELSRSIREALIELTGRAPHMIVSRLRRIKLDPNREITEAAQGNPFAENAWSEFQGSIEVAAEIVTRDFGSGLYLDIHGHGHDIARVELGYLLSRNDLTQSDVTLNVPSLVAKSSVRALAGTVDISFAKLIRGPASLGALLQQRGTRSVPSTADPDPDGGAYFSGGYNTKRHGSRDGGTISGIQLEHHFPGLRDTVQNRNAYAAMLADALVVYLEAHFGLTVSRPGS